MVALNPVLDVGAIAAAFARDGRVHIPAILTDESAARIHRCLEQETQFMLLAGPGDAPLRPVHALTGPEQGQMMAKAYTQARENFQFLYDAHSMSNDGEPYPDPSHYLSAVTEFLNSAPVLDFARQVTGLADIAYTSAQATRYRPGQFLNQHDDGTGRGRRAAYVLNLTPRWRNDWGGALLFSDRPGHVREGFLPAFNALNMFRVPQDHLVGFVSPFAGAARYSITGWFSAL